MSAGALVVAGALILWSQPAGAEEPVPDTWDLLEDLAPSAVTERLVGPDEDEVTLDGVTAAVSDDVIAITSETASLTLTAPPTGDSSAIEAFVLDDASALFAIRLDDATAPRTYSFSTDVPADGVLEVTDSGGVFIADGEGNFLGAFAPPWAKDANGVDVPTWFTVSGSDVVQHVDIDAVPNLAFPVVADPWAGQALYQAAWVTNQGGSTYVVHTVPTAHGRTTTSVLAHDAHIAELKAKLGTLSSKVTGTIQDQLICHVMFNQNGRYGGATWSLESWRPPMSWFLMVPSSCNP